MVVKSGVTKGNMPFRAPIYSSYREAIKALSNQGFLGFYKGNLAGMLHLTFFYGFKTQIATLNKFGEFDYYWKNSGIFFKMPSSKF